MEEQGDGSQVDPNEEPGNHPIAVDHQGDIRRLLIVGVNNVILIFGLEINQLIRRLIGVGDPDDHDGNNNPDGNEGNNEVDFDIIQRIQRYIEVGEPDDNEGPGDDEDSDGDNDWNDDVIDDNIVNFNINNSAASNDEIVFDIDDMDFDISNDNADMHANQHMDEAENPLPGGSGMWREFADRDSEENPPPSFSRKAVISLGKDGNRNIKQISDSASDNTQLKGGDTNASEDPLPAESNWWDEFRDSDYESDPPSGGSSRTSSDEKC